MVKNVYIGKEGRFKDDQDRIIFQESRGSSLSPCILLFVKPTADRGAGTSW
jgi:hypothetical protein